MRKQTHILFTFSPKLVYSRTPHIQPHNQLLKLGGPREPYTYLENSVRHNYCYRSGLRFWLRETAIDWCNCYLWLSWHVIYRSVHAAAGKLGLQQTTWGHLVHSIYSFLCMYLITKFVLCACFSINIDVVLFVKVV